MAALALALVDPPESPTDAVKEEYISVVHFEHWNDRDIKEISIGHIYKQTLLSRFNFAKPYKIITAEKNPSIHKSKDVYLLSRDDIRSYRSKYQFLHIGLVQFSIYCSGCSTQLPFVSISLRDSKYPNFHESVLVRFESDLPLGRAVKFNWFPNFSAPLSDLANSNALVVTIDPQHTPSIDVRYRVVYKIMKTSLKPDYLFENPVLEVNTENTNVVPKSNNQWIPSVMAGESRTCEGGKGDPETMTS